MAQQLVDDSTIIDLAAVSKSFDGDVVLTDLDLRVRQGEIVALLGRSGSGKSTILRLVANLEQPNAGRVHVGTRSSVAFQEPRLLPWKSVVKNVALGLRSGTKAERSQRAGEILAEVGLAEKQNVWPLTLSGGQAQRASLARALVSEPGLLLLDEPFSALDALTRLEMHDLLLRVWARRQCAVLLVTHDVDEALVLADRIVVLEGGHISTQIQIDTPRPRALHDPSLTELRQQLLSRLGAPTTTGASQEAQL